MTAEPASAWGAPSSKAWDSAETTRPAPIPRIGLSQGTNRSAVAFTGFSHLWPDRYRLAHLQQRQASQYAYQRRTPLAGAGSLFNLRGQSVDAWRQTSFVLDAIDLVSLPPSSPEQQLAEWLWLLYGCAPVSASWFACRGAAAAWHRGSRRFSSPSSMPIQQVTIVGCSSLRLCRRWRTIASQPHEVRISPSR